MSRKKIIPEELYEEEKIMPAEENNCFAWDNKCTILTNTKLSKQDKVNCGTLRCKWYKPKEHENSVKHITPDGVSFETVEEYAGANKYAYLTREEIKAYELMPHASEEEVDSMYEEYLANKPEEDLSTLKKTELYELAKDKKLPVNAKMKKEELLSILTNMK